MANTKLLIYDFIYTTFQRIKLNVRNRNDFPVKLKQQGNHVPFLVLHLDWKHVAKVCSLLTLPHAASYCLITYDAASCCLCCIMLLMLHHAAYAASSCILLNHSGSCCITLYDFSRNLVPKSAYGLSCICNTPYVVVRHKHCDYSWRTYFL